MKGIILFLIAVFSVLNSNAQEGNLVFKKRCKARIVTNDRKGITVNLSSFGDSAIYFTRRLRGKHQVILDSLKYSQIYVVKMGSGSQKGFNIGLLTGVGLGLITTASVLSDENNPGLLTIVFLASSTVYGLFLGGIGAIAGAFITDNVYINMDYQVFLKFKEDAAAKAFKKLQPK